MDESEFSQIIPPILETLKLIHVIGSAPRNTDTDIPA